MLEPGRAIVGNAGVLLTRVEYLKLDKAKRFAVVDASMSELIRPALYQSWHDIVPVVERNSRRRRRTTSWVPVCESADVLGTDRAPGGGTGRRSRDPRRRRVREWRWRRTTTRARDPPKCSSTASARVEIRARETLDRSSRSKNASPTLNAR